jgi:hypothetical protein
LCKKIKNEYIRYLKKIPNLLKLKLSITKIILFGLILFSSVIHAQNIRYKLQEHDYKPYHFGFYVAVNQMNFSILTDREKLNKKIYGISSKPTIGFTLGLIGNKKINQYLDLRFTPGLAFGERILDYTFEDSNSKKEITIKSTHIDLPVYIKYKSKRAKNFRAYVLGGAKLSIDLAANSEKNVTGNEKTVLLKKNDLMLEAGVGFNFYMEFFKFGIEIKMSYGLFDLKNSKNNIYADGIKSLRSKNFMISLTFE